MASISESFVLNNTQPNFTRDHIESFEAMRAIFGSVKVRKYDIGHIVYCEEDGVHYKFEGEDIEFDEVTGYFRKLIEVDVSELESQLDENTKKIDTLWNKIFPPPPPPTTSASISAYHLGTSNTISNPNAVGAKVNVELKFSLRTGGVNVGIDEIDKITIKYGSKTITLLPNTSSYEIGEISTSTTFTITYYMVEGKTYSASTSISFINYSYNGVVNEDVTIDKIDVTKLSKSLKTSKLFSTTVALNNQKNCYIYPASFGKLSSIKDDKNYELINSYLCETITIDGENYYAYLLEYAVTVTNYKLTFS